MNTPPALPPAIAGPAPKPHPVDVALAALSELAADGPRFLSKLDAYADRRASAKGRKDERDLIRIAHILSRQRLHKQWLEPYLAPEDVQLFADVSKSSEFVAMTRNAKQASDLRADFRTLLNVTRGAVEKRR